MDAAARATFAQEPSFSLRNFALASLPFSGDRTAAHTATNSDSPVQALTAKRTSHFANEVADFKLEVKKAKRMKTTRERHPSSVSGTRRSLGGHTSGLERNISTLCCEEEGNRQVLQSKAPSAAFECARSSESAASSRNDKGGVTQPDAANDRHVSNKHTHETSDDMHRRKTRRQHNLTEPPASHCLAARAPSSLQLYPGDKRCRNWDPVYMPAYTGSSTDLLDEYGKNIREHCSVRGHGEACNPYAAMRKSASGSLHAFRNASETLSSRGVSVSYSEPLSSETSMQGVLGAHTESSGSGGQASPVSGQLLCTLENGREMGSAHMSGFMGVQRDSSTGADRSPAHCPIQCSEANAHDGAVICLLQSPDGSYLVSSGSDGRIRLWNAGSGCHCFVHMNVDIPLGNCSVSASAGSRLSPGIPPQQPPGPGKQPKMQATKASCSIWGIQAAIPRSGDFLIHGRGRVLCASDIFSGALQHITSDYTDDIVCVTWNDDRNEAYSGAFDGSILIYDAPGRSQTRCTMPFDQDQAPGEDVSRLLTDCLICFLRWL